MTSTHVASDRVGVVIVNYNGGDTVLRALDALRTQTTAPDRVLVVDNASTDGSAAEIARVHPWVELIEPGSNTGFAAGNNIGVRLLGDCEWIALLNPDAFPEPNWLAELLDATRRRPDYSFFASLLLDDADPLVIDGAGDAYHGTGLAWRLRHGMALGEADLAEVEVFGPCAAAALYRRSAVEDAGLFDERWFCYLEDVDLAFRLRLRGERCLFVPSSRARHMGSSVTGRESAFTLYYSHRNLVWTWIRDMPGPLVVRNLPHLLLGTALSIGYYGTRGNLKTLLRAKRDGFAALPWLLRERRQIQGTATVDWRELQAMLQPAWDGYRTASGRASASRDRAVAAGTELAAGFRPVTLPRILVISTAPLGAEMRGVGIRSYELARCLTDLGHVTLAGVGDAAEPDPALDVIAYRYDNPIALKSVIQASDVVIAQPPTPMVLRWIVRSGARFIADLYDPEVLENLELFAETPARMDRVWIDLTTDRLALSLRHAHHLICASERQRDLWLGAMLMERAIDFERYRADPTLDDVLAVVPFGVPGEAPVHESSKGLRAQFPAIEPSDRVILWNGGLWNWLDPLTAVRAVARVAERLPGVRLVTMGSSTHRAALEAEAATRELASSLGLLDRVVFMNGGWVPYADRASWLLEADCAVSCHANHLETRFAFRTRLLDCFWSGLPVVCTEGDELADLVARDDLGAAVPIGDDVAMASAFEQVLARGRDAYADRLRQAAATYAWDAVSAPLRRMVALGAAPRRGRRGDARTGELVRSSGVVAYRRSAAAWHRLSRRQ